ncbi:MAG: arsenate reductase ArsC [Bacteroidetes bacterium]|nr:arsenate reductase ArsC [Bacteroidota bacterium]
MKKILVLCTGNSCRSQMAEAYLRFFGKDRVEVFSAGIEAHGLNPDAVQTMLEDGIDISHHTSNVIDEYKNIQFDYVITVCDNAREVCPYLPGTENFHHNFRDPSKYSGNPELKPEKFRKVRNEIRHYCKMWIKDNVTSGNNRIN